LSCERRAALDGRVHYRRVRLLGHCRVPLMTTMEKCPECGERLVRVWPENDVAWKHCNRCGWDEKKQLHDKVWEEVHGGGGT
jgi:Zn ribbon nucleic-acid-binding protein